MDPASDILDENATLLQHSNGFSTTAARPNYNRILIHAGLVIVVLISVPLFLWTTLPSDPLKAADIILRKAPTIICPVPPPCIVWADGLFVLWQDGHIDLQWLVHSAYGNNVTAVDLGKPMLREVDIPRLCTGRVGGFFWYVVLCPSYPQSRVHPLRSYAGPCTRHDQVIALQF